MDYQRGFEERSTASGRKSAIAFSPISSGTQGGFRSRFGVLRARKTGRAKSRSGARTTISAWAATGCDRSVGQGGARPRRGRGRTRNISGTHHPIVQLEAELADLHGKAAALVFTSGWVSNLAGISTIASLLPNCLILSDALNHNSMIEGVRRSGCEKRVWRHSDVGHLEELLAAEPIERAKLIVFESLYSMDGDIAPIAAIVRWPKNTMR